jgi:hypothetical protein
VFLAVFFASTRQSGHFQKYARLARLALIRQTVYRVLARLADIRQTVLQRLARLANIRQAVYRVLARLADIRQHSPKFAKFTKIRQRPFLRKM